MVDGGWIAVAGAVAGGSLTGTIALLQARWQHKSDAAKTREDRRWTEQVTARERDHVESTRRRDELLEIYTRYQLAADRLENAVRELADARGSARAGEPRGDSKADHLGDDLYKIKQDLHEAAQNEYDQACEIVKLIAPLHTVEAILGQRRMFNGFVTEAFDGRYDHAASYPAIVEAANPVLGAMRSDLASPT